MAVTVIANHEQGANGDAASGTITGYDSITVTGGTATVSTAHPASGTRSMRHVGSTSSGLICGLKNITSTAVVAFDQKIWINAAPSAEIALIFIGTGGTRCLVVGIDAAGKLNLRDAGASGGAILWTSTNALPTAASLRISVFSTRNASTGTVRVAAFLGNSSSPISGADSGMLTGRNTGAADFSAIRNGLKCVSSTATGDIEFDDARYDPAASDLISPTAAPPTLAVTTFEDNHVVRAVATAGGNAVTGISVTPSTGVTSYGSTTDRTFVLPHISPTGDAIDYVFTATDGTLTGGQIVTVDPDVAAAVNIAAPLRPIGAVPTTNYG